MDEVHGLRDQYGADLVQLVVEGGCGVAYLMSGNNPNFAPYALSVVSRLCISPNYSLGHELGHNMGCNHAPEDPVGTGAYDYSFGYKDLDHGFRTIMAYSPGARLIFQPRVPRRLGDRNGDSGRAVINNVRAQTSFALRRASTAAGIEWLWIRVYLRVLSRGEHQL
jgi:hypothetical protein